MAKSSTKATPKSTAKAAQATGQLAPAAGEKSPAATSPVEAPVEEANVPVADSAGPESRTDQSEQGDGGVDPNPRGATVATPRDPAASVTLAFPLPDDVPAEALKNASIVVTSKSPSGRRRAGFAFTREETLIPYASLNEEQIAALTGDADLIVGLRPA